jgi:hypothetical protein
VGTLARASIAATGLVLALAVTAPPASAHTRADGPRAPVVVLDPAASRLVADERAQPSEPPVRTPRDAAAATVGVDVVPQPLTLLGAPPSVTLVRVGRSADYRATVGHVRVVDARGTRAGWHFAATLGGSDGTRHAASIEVRRVVVFARTTVGIHVRDRAYARPGLGAWIVAAAPGTGNGAFDVTVTISLRLHAGGHRPAPRAVSVPVRWSLT